MTATASARLLAVDPDLGRFLGEEERRDAEHLAVPVFELPKGELDVVALLRRAGAFSAIVLDGMLLDRLQLGDQAAIRLLGPGDVLSQAGPSPSMLISHVAGYASTPARLAMIGSEVLHAARRWPGIVVGLHERMSDQADRIAAQLVICQLPRVDQRLLAMMWLLAESWGQVTSVGTTLPLSLTHDVLGEMVGARRPTVTLALGELSERGALVRQDRGWLLVEPPPSPSGPPPRIEQPGVLDDGASLWSDPSREQARVTEQARDALAETVTRLRREHAHNVVLFQQRMLQMVSTRERGEVVRSRLSHQWNRRRPAPS